MVQDGAGEISRTARRTNTAKRAPDMQMHHRHVLYTFVWFPFCGIFTPTRTSSENNKWKQQCHGAGEHLKNDKLRVVWVQVRNVV